MRNNSIEDYNQLEEYYIQKLVNIADMLKAKSIVWEDVFAEGVKLPKETVVQIWRSPFEKTMQEV